jgi:WD40 repeat protein
MGNLRINFNNFMGFQSIKYNHRLAEYFQSKAYGIKKDWTGTYKRGFSESVYNYLIAKEFIESSKLLSCYSFIFNKIKHELLDNLMEDYFSFNLEAPDDEIEKIAIWYSFFREKAYIFRRGTKEWPSYKILIQLAIEHAEDSPLTKGVEKWLEDGCCDWIWMRQLTRLAHTPKNSCVAKLEGHTDSINGALILTDGKILSWSKDKTLKIWDNNAFRCILTLEDHNTSVIGALEMMDGRILSWTENYENSLRIWNRHNGVCLAILKGHTRSINGALELSNGALVSWAGKDRSIYYEEEEEKELYRRYIVSTTHKAAPDEDADTDLRLWDCESGHCKALLKGHTCAVVGALELSNKQLVTWSEDWTIRIWDLPGALCNKTLEGHRGEVIGVMEMSNGRLLSWSKDHTIRLWNIQMDKPLKTLEGHTGEIGGVFFLSGDQILSWANDPTLRLWDCETGECLKTYEGHLGSVIGALQLKDGRILSWSWDKTLRMWNRLSGICELVLSGHTQQIDGVIELNENRILSYAKNEKSFHIWDSKTGECIVVNRLMSWGFIQVLKMPNEEILSVQLDNKSLQIWETKNESTFNLNVGHNGYVSGIIALTQGRCLSWSVDGSLCLWDCKDGSLIKTFFGPKGRVTGALELENGRIVSWTQEDELEGLRISVWDKNCEYCIRTFGSPMRPIQNYEVYALSGDRLLSFYKTITTVFDYENFKKAPSWNLCKDIALWDLNTGTCIQKYSGNDIEDEHPEWSQFLEYSLDRKITSKGFLFENKMVYAYIIKQGSDIPIAVWHGENDTIARGFYPEGRAIVTQNPGQVCMLQLYFSNKQITLEELEQTLNKMLIN